MRRKRRFKWSGKTECSMTELVSENGALRSDLVLLITEQLCLLLEHPDNAGPSARVILHPDRIAVNQYGEVRFTEQDVPASELEAYLPPELDRADPSSPRARVYALGMLMLYMSTGQEKKAEAEIALDNSALLPLIERSTAFDPDLRYESVRDLLTAVRREKNTGRKLFPVLLTVLFIGLLAAALFFAWQKGTAGGAESGAAAGYESGYARGYGQGFSNAPGIGMSAAAVPVHSGNLSGNYAAEEGPITAFRETDVFFLSDGDLFRMNAFTGETQLLRSDPGAYGLQYYEGSLYCCTQEHILRIDPDTAKEEILCDSNGGRLYIYDDVLYFHDSGVTGYLYRINPDKKELTQLAGTGQYRCLNVADRTLYYIDPSNGNVICRSDINGGNLSIISSGAYESFCIYDGGLYVGTEYGLVRMDLNGGSPEILSALPASGPNASDSGVFYISGREKTLEWLSPDGRTRFTVVPTRTSSFQVAGQWIFYRNEEDGGRLWKVRISGSDSALAVQ